MATHEGYTIFTGASVTCNTCGALVTNTVIHDEWHAKVGLLLRTLQNLQARMVNVELARLERYESDRDTRNTRNTRPSTNAKPETNTEP